MTKTSFSWRWRLGESAAVGLILAYCFRRIVWPSRLAQPEFTDAIVVLGPPVPERLRAGQRLAHAYGARLLVFAGRREPWRVVDLSLEASTDVIDPEPHNTLGEAGHVREWAERVGAENVIILTFRPHVSRARSIFRREVGARAIVLDSGERVALEEWVYQLIYQPAAKIAELLRTRVRTAVDHAGRW